MKLLYIYGGIVAAQTREKEFCFDVCHNGKDPYMPHDHHFEDDGTKNDEFLFESLSVIWSLYFFFFSFLLIFF